MDKQMTISAFNDELAQVRTKKKEFLTQIERIVPWKEWLCLIQPCYYKGERGNYLREQPLLQSVLDQQIAKTAKGIAVRNLIAGIYAAEIRKTHGCRLLPLR